MDDGSLIPANKKGVSLFFSLNEGYTAKSCFVPLLYYKGYIATLTTDNGEQILLIIDDGGPNHFIQIYFPENVVGTITINYTGTTIQNISHFFSIISL